MGLRVAHLILWVFCLRGVYDHVVHVFLDLLFVRLCLFIGELAQVHFVETLAGRYSPEESAELH